MTPVQKKYLTEKYIRPMVKKMLKENQQTYNRLLKSISDEFDYISDQKTKKQLAVNLIEFLQRYTK